MAIANTNILFVPNHLLPCGVSISFCASLQLPPLSGIQVILHLHCPVVSFHDPKRWPVPIVSGASFHAHITLMVSLSVRVPMQGLSLFHYFLDPLTLRPHWIFSVENHPRVFPVPHNCCDMKCWFKCLLPPSCFFSLRGFLRDIRSGKECPGHD